MKIRVAHIALLWGITAVMFSCNDAPSKNHGPIVLGDSATIVTENDPQRLKDLVTDLQPVIPETKDTTEVQPAAAAQDTSKKAKPNTTATVAAQQVQAPLPDGPGLKAEFKEVTVMVPGLNAKQAGRPNLKNANGAVYTFENGNLNGSTLRVTGNITKVSQRYQSVVVLKNELGSLPVESLSTTTAWTAMKGSNNQYRITDLDAKSLDFPDVGANAIRSAVSKAAKRHHFSRRKVEEWENSVRRVRAANQKPMYVMLRSVMWKIDGKDANGRIFSKQIRVDMPM